MNKTRHNSTNGTDEAEYELGFTVAQDLFPLVLAIFIVIVNTFVLVLVYKRKALQTVTNYILCSLASADLLTGLCSIPAYIACNTTWALQLCLIDNIMLRITSISIVLNLLLVTVDRYLAILYSLRYHSLVTKKLVFVLLSFIWLISLFTGLIQLAWYLTDDLNVHHRPESIKEKEVPYDIASIVLFFAIPLLAMIVTYSFIFFEVLRQSRNIKKNSIPGYQENRKQTRHEWKAAFMFAVMLVVFTACWLPFFILRFQQNFGNKFFELPHLAEYILHMLRFLTSFINPCLYIFGKHDFRKALSKVFNVSRKPSRAEMTRSSLLKTTEF